VILLPLPFDIGGLDGFPMAAKELFQFISPYFFSFPPTKKDLVAPHPLPRFLRGKSWRYLKFPFELIENYIS